MTIRKTLKSIVLTGLALCVAGCIIKIEEPIKEDYFNKKTTVFVLDGIEMPIFGDLDNDGEIDVISEGKQAPKYPLYIFEGHEKYFKAYEMIRAKKMTPQMREAATNISNGIKEFNYERAEEKYKEFYRLSSKQE